MTERFPTRASDGSTIDLKKQEAEQADVTARAKRTILVNSSGTIIKATTQEENRAGSDASGSDGATGRVLTLQNTSTSGAPISVWVDDQIIAQADITVSHLSASSTITFDNINFLDAAEINPINIIINKNTTIILGIFESIIYNMLLLQFEHHTLKFMIMTENS